MQSPVSTTTVKKMFNEIAPTYDLLNTVLSFGLHSNWEKKAVDQLPHCPQGSCLDLCTGTGALVPYLAKRFQYVVGSDISSNMLSIAREKWRSLENCTWVEADARSLPFEGERFDAVSVAYGIRNLPSPVDGLKEICRVTKKGGRLVVLEFGQPTNQLWREMFNFYSRYFIPFVGGVISGHESAYRYLPATSAQFPCGVDFERLLIEADWKPEKTIRLCGGVAYIYLAEKG